MHTHNIKCSKFSRYN